MVYIKVGTVGVITCDGGFDMVGSSDIECTKSGKFTRPGKCAPSKSHCTVN